MPPSPLGQGASAGKPPQDQELQEKAERWQIQHILFPAMRRYIAAPKTLLELDIVQVADLPELYKVFERC